MSPPVCRVYAGGLGLMTLCLGRLHEARSGHGSGRRHTSTVRPHSGWREVLLSPERIMRCIRLYGEKVIPLVREMLAADGNRAR